MVGGRGICRLGEVHAILMSFHSVYVEAVHVRADVEAHDHSTLVVTVADGDGTAFCHSTLQVGNLGGRWYRHDDAEISA